MIVGRNDTWLTISEFAEMIGRSEKTIRNWASQGRIQFVHLCGAPLVSLRIIETLIATHADAYPENAELALRLMGKDQAR